MCHLYADGMGIRDADGRSNSEDPIQTGPRGAHAMMAVKETSKKSVPTLLKIVDWDVKPQHKQTKQALNKKQ